MPEVSFSELDALRQCAHKHQLAYLERWRPEREAPALLRGRLAHMLLACHYAANTGVGVGVLGEAGGGPGGGEGRLAGALEGYRSELTEPMLRVPGLLEAYTELLQTLEQLAKVDTDGSERERLSWLYQGYVEHYQLDEGWKVRGIEVPFSIWLPTERGTRSTYRLKGRIDLLVQAEQLGSGLWIVDHKTCKDLPTEKDLDLDDQMGLYTYLLRRRGLDIRGVIYNALRTQRLVRPMSMKERFSRTITVRTETELQTMAQEALRQLRHAHGSRGRNGRRQLDAPRSPNPDTCKWRCPFTEPCLASRKGADERAMLADMGFVVDLTRH